MPGTLIAKQSDEQVIVAPLEPPSNVIALMLVSVDDKGSVDCTL